MAGGNEGGFVGGRFCVMREAIGLFGVKGWWRTAKESLHLLHGYLSTHQERLGCRERLLEGRAAGSGQVERHARIRWGGD